MIVKRHPLDDAIFQETLTDAIWICISTHLAFQKEAMLRKNRFKD